jgi:membrane protein
MLGRLRAWWEHSRLGRFVRKYQADDGDTLAAMIAFSAVFSLFPLLVGCLTVVGLVMRDPQRLQALTETIQRLFPASVGDLLTFLDETREISGLLSVVSLLGLLWAGTALVGSMTRAFNRFYAAPDRAFMPQKLVEATMIVVFLVLTVASILASSAGALIAELGTQLLAFWSPGALAVAHLLGLVLSLLTGLMLFLAMFRIVPNAPVSISGVWRGALLSAALFVLILQMFPLYIRFFGGGFETYKTIGLLPLLLTWFYMLARIIVVGAELNAFLDPTSSRATAQLPVESDSVTRSPQARRPVLTIGAVGVLLLLLWRASRGANRG